MRKASRKMDAAFALEILANIKSLFNAFTVLVLFSLCVPQTVCGRKVAYLMAYFLEHGHNAYFAVSRDGLHNLYYSYVNDDYNTLLTFPRQLFEYPKACSCIDSDITKVGDKYHLYYVAHDSDDSGVKHAVSDHATGPYTYEPEWCDPERTPCEAPTLWQMIERDEWILMYDVFSARPNNMGFSSTTDFVHYANLGYFNQGEMKTTNFSSPKHGAVVQITKKELRRLKKLWKFEL